MMRRPQVTAVLITSLALAWSNSQRLYSEEKQVSLGDKTHYNLMQIGVGLHNYHQIHKSLPKAAKRNGINERFLSWRVEILTLCGEKDLYEAFRHDEPW